MTFFAYNNAGKKGIGCGLNGVQKTRDGEPLASTVTAEEAFTAMPGAAAVQPAAPQPTAPSYPQTYPQPQPQQNAWQAPPTGWGYPAG